ncbi:NAD(P)/FAD-dependent oxidoreductase [uncultured Porphyromonas sp.]|uniref:NAD(P)/FAD-dependent oxidoreductase n=1 Tax=uncultured Porphyromonas sp. TaxID=159274 RepID=UPI0026168A7E|nr:NAD(P)/FAD-dependent oxidoreductase [uncultured Porphyromonas sp.]
MSINIPQSSLPRVVIAGGGFGGLKLAQSLDSDLFQVVLIDHHNYHQFPPLIYQVASSGLEPSSIAFPFRSAFRKKKNFLFRMAEVEGVDTLRSVLITSVGEVPYDYLVLACGGTTNFFGNEEVARHSLPMKTLYEAINLRNILLQNIEKALVSDDEARRDALLTVAIVGGGPSGVEIAGALAEMKRYVLPKDYPYLDSSLFRIHLLDASPRLLQAMSEKSSETAARGLAELGVEIHTGTMVSGYDGKTLTLSDGTEMQTRTVIWVSGIVANTIEGISAETLGRGRRILVDEHSQVLGLTNIFAIGDQSLMTADPKYPNGHPQLAQVALQQAKFLAHNLKARLQNQPESPFRYRDLGSMATIGRNRAVAEIGKAKWGGFTAWVLWLVVHLRSILSVRNKVVVLLNWIWNYVTYDRSLRLILKRNVPVEPYHQRLQRELKERPHDEDCPPHK